MNDIKLERVLCVPSKRLVEISKNNQGFIKRYSFYNDLFNRDLTAFSFQRRSSCESDESFKQIITYSIIQHTSSLGETLLFSYTRGPSGGEDRLKQKLSLGIGGHVSESTFDLTSKDIFKSLKSEAFREINEEIVCDDKNPLVYFSGMINDDSDEVGRVHLGLVYLFQTSDFDVKSREPEISDGRMIPLGDVQDQYERYESWSKIFIKESLKKSL